jgi:CRISPR/Cas system-associated exonuclease Cas4 (RecB family)
VSQKCYNGSMAYVKYSSPAYKPGQKGVHKLSRSKIELFMQCPRCFWLGEVKKIKRPDGPPFQINKAIDELFKKEFDQYRELQEPHPIMEAGGVEAVPFAHEDMDKWRHNFTGVTYLHLETNFHMFGAVDDVWIDLGGNLIVVDYKATAKDGEVNLDATWQDSYRRQMEIYQWLLRRNGFEVSDTGYFVYANGLMTADGFYDKLDFKTKLIAHTGKDDWVEDTIIKMKECLESDTIPPVGNNYTGDMCDHCAYAKARTELTLDAIRLK